MVALRFLRIAPIIALLLTTQPLPAVACQRGDLPAERSDRKVAVAAEISLRPGDFGDVVADGTRIAGDHRGFVTTSELAYRRHRFTGRLVLAVPAAEFEQTLAELRRVGWTIDRERILRSDVTEELAQVTARIANRQLEEKRYALVLHAAKLAPEMLDVQRILTTIREDIERLAAQQKELSERVVFSAITLTMPESAPTCR